MYTMESVDELDAELHVHRGPYVVLVHDTVSDETDAEGPYPGPEALLTAARLQAQHDAEGLDGITVRVVPLHPADVAAEGVTASC